MASPVFLTPREVSEYLRGIDVRTLANWRCNGNKGGGPGYIKVGGRILYPVPLFEAWLARRTRE